MRVPSLMRLPFGLAGLAVVIKVYRAALARYRALGYLIEAIVAALVLPVATAYRDKHGGSLRFDVFIECNHQGAPVTKIFAQA